MGMFGAIDTAGSGMTAERLRMDVISNNIANVNTTRTAEGGPYRRQLVVFAPRTPGKSFRQTLEGCMEPGEGVRAVSLTKEYSPFRLVYEPGHPDANKAGYVEMPNVNVVTEMVDMLTATRAYEANVTAVNAAKSMAMKALDIGR